MREKHKSFIVALGTLVCSMVAAATGAEGKVEGFTEQPQIIDGHTLEAVTATRETTAPKSGAVEDVARGNVASRASIEVQLQGLLPLREAGVGLSDLVEHRDRTEVVVTLTEAPPDLVGPNLIVEIHEGTCVDLKSASVRPSNQSSAAYSLTPSVFSLRSFGAILPVSFAALQSSAHALAIRTGSDAGIATLTCVDV